MLDWSVIFSVVLCLLIVVGLYFNPSPEALLMIVAVASLILYGTGRYWRHREGFRSREGFRGSEGFADNKHKKAGN